MRERRFRGRASGCVAVADRLSVTSLSVNINDDFIVLWTIGPKPTVQACLCTVPGYELFRTCVSLAPQVWNQCTCK